ncbi:hypothetical protein TSOC_002401, partial [Tetrabaena socialis]
CQQVIGGYTLAPNVDHGGDDIQCPTGISAQAAADLCSRDVNCKAFNHFQRGGQWQGCVKRVASPVSAPPSDIRNMCFYTKAVTGCQQVTGGYTLAPNVDHGGDDIQCPTGISAQAAADLCSRDVNCKAFNHFERGGQSYGCVKRVATPVSAPPSDIRNMCFYTKAAT